MSKDVKFTVYGSQIQKWTDDIQMLVKQREEYKAENEQHKEERDILIDDISWYKEKVGKLEQIREIKDSALKALHDKNKKLEDENRELKDKIKGLK